MQYLLTKEELDATAQGMSRDEMSKELDKRVLLIVNDLVAVIEMHTGSRRLGADFPQFAQMLLDMKKAIRSHASDAL